MEHVAPLAVGDASADILLVLLVRKSGGHIADGMEVVGVHIVDADLTLERVKPGGGFRIVGHGHGHKGDLVVEMVEDDDVTI